MNEAHAPRGPPMGGMPLKSSHKPVVTQQELCGMQFPHRVTQGHVDSSCLQGLGKLEKSLEFSFCASSVSATVLFLTLRSSCSSYLEDQAVPWEQVMLWRLCVTRSQFPVSAMEARGRPPMFWGDSRHLRSGLYLLGLYHVVTAATPTNKTTKKDHTELIRKNPWYAIRNVSGAQDTK